MLIRDICIEIVNDIVFDVFGPFLETSKKFINCIYNWL